MVDDRKLSVLKAIVSDYVSSREPVGSKALVERHNLGVSPATVRNDMASLEEEGYIAQPHTSAGRVPTDKGYRLFVDRLATVKPLSGPERRAISTFLSGAADVDDIVIRTVRLLAEITQQVAIVQYPVLDSSTVRHVELVSMSTERVLVIAISSTGRIEQRTLEIGAHTEDDLAEWKQQINRVVEDNRSPKRSPPSGHSWTSVTTDRVTTDRVTPRATRPVSPPAAVRCSTCSAPAPRVASWWGECPT